MSLHLLLEFVAWALMLAVVAVYMIVDARQARAVQVARERELGAAMRRHPAGSARSTAWE